MTVPIVPGPDQPQYFPPIQPAPPPPVYYPQAPGPSDVVGKAAVGTVTVLVTLVIVLCALPLFGCLVIGVMGLISSPPASP